MKYDIKNLFLRGLWEGVRGVGSSVRVKGVDASTGRDFRWDDYCFMYMEVKLVAISIQIFVGNTMYR